MLAADDSAVLAAKVEGSTDESRGELVIFKATRAKAATEATATKRFAWFALPPVFFGPESRAEEKGMDAFPSFQDLFLCVYRVPFYVLSHYSGP